MRNPIVGVRASLALGLGAAMFCAGNAQASTVLEVGDNGSEQMGRGGAWVARASDPLATFYNPAGLAGQPTRLTLQANINMQSQCFTRLKAANDTTSDGVKPGQSYPQVCNNSPPFPDPQVAFTYHATDRLGLGVALVAPSAAGNVDWPSNDTAPNRYLLSSSKTFLLTPTIGAGWEPVDNLRIGLGLIWGFGTIDFANFSAKANQDNVGAGYHGNDIKGEIKGHDWFIPGATTGVIWSATDTIDIAGWYKISGDIKAKGDIITTAQGQAGQGLVKTNTADTDCGAKSLNHTCSPNSVAGTIPIPMEAKLGFRYHMLRAGANTRHVRDPMAQDVFDIEADLTWAHDSQFTSIDISVPANIPVHGAAGTTIPTDASVIHDFRDVVGARFGGDYNILPDQLAIRAGAYFETAAQRTQYQNIDFAGEQRVGIAGGATYRVHLGQGEHTKALELSAGLGHTFIATSSNLDPNSPGVKGLAGTQCFNTASSNPNTCPNGAQPYRTAWPVNLGTITNAFTQINVGISYRF